MSAKTKPRPPAKRILAPPRPEPTHEEIALCARAIWEAEGRPEGRDVAHWLLAEARLRQRCQAATDTPARPSSRTGSRRKPSGRVVL